MSAPVMFRRPAAELPLLETADPFSWPWKSPPWARPPELSPPVP